MLYQQNYNFGSKEPSAFITVRKQRQKQNGKNVYLHDTTEFEIELHNPTNDSILAKISLNGNRISNSGVVLKPGQRTRTESFYLKPMKFQIVKLIKGRLSITDWLSLSSLIK